jgi:hypothetical protein
MIRGAERRPDAPEASRGAGSAADTRRLPPRASARSPGPYSN